MQPTDRKAVIAAADNVLRHASQSDIGASFSLADMRNQATAALQNMERDSAAVAGALDGPKSGHDYARQFIEWRKQPPAMAGVLLAAADKLNIDASEPALLAAALASFAADIPLKHAYHDNNHFREVTAMMAVYCNVNQQLAANGHAGAVTLSGQDMAKCMLAAMGHDLLHDGNGNTVDGVHSQYRLEDRAIAAIEPFMRLAGMSDADCAEVATMIRVTDVSAPKGSLSPHKILRKMIAGEAVDVPAELALLKGDARLCTMAALMSDADLAPSAATNYITSRKQLQRVSAENPALPPTDQSLSGFLSFVVEKEFVSAAARVHSQGTLDDICKKTAGRLEAGAPNMSGMIAHINKQKP